jgi:hypothetical protein
VSIYSRVTNGRGESFLDRSKEVAVEKSVLARTIRVIAKFEFTTHEVNSKNGLLFSV